MAALKAANPNLKVLLYEALWFTNSNDYSYLQTATGCTAYADDAANHPSWFLHDQNGNKVLGVNRTDLYALDLGNASYQPPARTTRPRSPSATASTACSSTSSTATCRST